MTIGPEMAVHLSDPHFYVHRVNFALQRTLAVMPSE